MIRVATSDRVFVRNVGGNSTYAKAVMRSLSPLGVDHILLRPSRLELQGPSRAAAYIVYESTLLGKFARRRGADVLFFPADTGTLIASRNLPVVSTIHGVASRHIDGVRSARAERVWRLRVSRLASASDHIITPSQTSAVDIADVFSIPHSKISVIPHGIDHSRFHPKSPDGEVDELRRRFKLPNAFALYLGNLEPRKNLIPLIDAFESPRVEALALPLIIAGRPAWDSEPILHRLESAHSVRYVGPLGRDDVPGILRAASLFLFPSLYEGFGFPVLEAMACGTPVICSDRGSLRSVASVGARIVQDLSAAGIAAAVEEVVGDSGSSARRVAEGLNYVSTFRWEESAASHLRVFSSVISLGKG